MRLKCLVDLFYFIIENIISTKMFTILIKFVYVVCGCDFILSFHQINGIENSIFIGKNT